MGIDYWNGAAPSDIAYRFLTFNASAPFYFVILIIEYYLLLPVLQKLATAKRLAIPALISWASCFLIFYSRFYMEIKLPFFVVASAPTYLIFFVLGIYLRNNPIKLDNKILTLLVVFAIGLSLTETYTLYHNFHDIGFSVATFKTSSFLYATFVILLAFKNANKQFPLGGIFAFFGEISFGVFLSHIFFLTGVVRGIDKCLPAVKQSGLLYQFLLIMLTLMCCVVFALVARTINKTIAVKYLGQ